MSSPFPSFGQPEPDVVEGVAEKAAASPRSLDPKLVRSLLAGVAALAVVGGGAAGFLWVSSPPAAVASPGGASSGGASSGSGSTPAAPAPTTAPTPDGSFAVGGRAVFGTVTAAAAEAGDPAATSTSSASSIGAVGTVASGATPSNAVTRTRPSGNPSASGSAPVSRPGSVPSRTVSAPPSVSRSTAPGWEVASVGFVSGTDAYGVFDLDGERVRVAKGELIYPLSVRYAGLVVAKGETPTAAPTATPTASATPTQDASVTGVFVSANNPSAGWLVQSDVKKPTQLPAAARGRTTGQVRIGGVLRDQFWVRVDRDADVLLPVDSPVGATGLTLRGTFDDRVPGSSAFFTDGENTVYFGSMGEGESDGVLF